MTQRANILDLLNIQHPIIQAPMVGVSTPELAAAVSNAGALGSIGLGGSNPEQARELIKKTRALTNAPFNVNLFCHQPAQAKPGVEQAWLGHLAPLFRAYKTEPPASLSLGYVSFLESEAMLQVLLEERPAVISFHFGLPPNEWIEQLRDAGIKILACVTTPAEARQAEAAKVDALIAQGMEAGGHRGVFDPDNDELIGTFALVSVLAEMTDLPIIAAGGIMNGSGIVAAQKLGAAAVQMGTAFVCCPESSANEQYRKALLSERSQHTAISADISGRPARGMVNRLFTDIGGVSAPTRPDYPIAYDATKALSAAAMNQGDYDFAVQWAGQGAPLSRAMPAAELVDVLVREIEAAVPR
ncbi:nitronate monooxygenase family protein [Pseudomonas sp. OIL-1]|uniref:NAD(P)H-dependent flavin oxidoreductase n=1 Tax=Pseudomonas sp. OIL-1 TaxID=2706126 RepID=UPI0013A78751|nr:nitronate monooxygenase [Pseudomonas sp. OIL-1]QIB49981.1 nitronate monooxygenase [Pseudomonas sp. OIL-1]